MPATHRCIPWPVHRSWARGGPWEQAGSTASGSSYPLRPRASAHRHERVSLRAQDRTYLGPRAVDQGAHWVDCWRVVAPPGEPVAGMEPDVEPESSSEVVA